MGTNTLEFRRNDMEGISSLGGTNARGIHSYFANDKKWSKYEYTHPRNQIINLTVTFDPYKFTDSDTVWEGPKQVERFLSMKQKYWKYYYFCSEKHDNGRTHLHGQIILDKDVSRFDAWDNIVSFLKKKIGNISAKWNIEELNGPQCKEYPTYFDYATKEGNLTISYPLLRRTRDE